MIKCTQSVEQTNFKEHLELEAMEVLSEVSIDAFEFKVTFSPILDGACILWFRDTRVGRYFEALGRFSHFDKRNVLFFVSRYVTSDKLRREIDHRRFERRVKGMSTNFFTTIEKLSVRDKEEAYRQLFNLDSEIDPDCLSRRRKVMSKRFHPDAGGDDRAMSLINEAYDFLLHHSVS